MIEDCFCIVVAYLDWASPDHQSIAKYIFSSISERDATIATNYWKASTRFTTDSDDWVVRYLCNGKVHRDNDEPAVVSEKDQVWFINGRFHREGDRPAFVATSALWVDVYHYLVGGGFDDPWDDNMMYNPASKTCAWLLNGVPHRDGDQPAIVRYDESMQSVLKEWWRHGKRHRDIGPAVCALRYQEFSNTNNIAVFNKETWKHGSKIHDTCWRRKIFEKDTAMDSFFTNCESDEWCVVEIGGYTYGRL